MVLLEKKIFWGLLFQITVLQNFAWFFEDNKKGKDINLKNKGIMLIWVRGVAVLRIRSDPDLFGRIRILALINDPISTFFVCVKAKDTSGISVVKLFGSWRYFLEHIFIEKISEKKVVRKFIRVMIRIQNRIRTFSKVWSGSSQKSSGSATLLFRMHEWKHCEYFWITFSRNI
jgi:hypothetical protein